jgi:hypothetical protein
MNVSTTIISLFGSGDGSDPLPILLLVGPLILATIFYIIGKIFGVIRDLETPNNTTKEDEDSDYETAIKEDKTMITETVEDNDENQATLNYYTKAKTFASISDHTYDTDVFFETILRLEKEGYKCLTNWENNNESMVMFRKVKETKQPTKIEIPDTNTDSGFFQG